MEHVADVLRQLFVMLLAAKIGDEIFKRAGLPTLVGEILAGIIVGPSVLGWYQIGPETLLFAEIGVVLLLFQVGVETRIGELLRVGGISLAVAVLGVVLPLLGGVALGLAFGYPLSVALFVGAALTATSVGVTSRALRSAGMLEKRAGRIVIGAAVVDDILAMLVVAVAAAAVAGDIDPLRLAGLVVVAVGFVALVGLGGTQLLRRRRSLLTDPEFAETPFLPGMLLMLGLAALSAAIGLAAIIGAFLAGMIAGESSERHALEREVAPVAAFFTPFFFGAIGAQIDLASLADVGVLWPMLAIIVTAIATKLAGAFLGAIRSGFATALAVGLAMVPRGEVGIVIAGLGLQLGAVSPALYGALVGMAVVTTIIIPPILPVATRSRPLPEEGPQAMESG